MNPALDDVYSMHVHTRLGVTSQPHSHASTLSNIFKSNIACILHVCATTQSNRLILRRNLRRRKQTNTHRSAVTSASDVDPPNLEYIFHLISCVLC